MLLPILLAILIVVAVAMTGVILLQRSEGGGLVSGGGQLAPPRGTANVLTKATQILAAVFIIMSLAITVITGRQAGVNSVTDRLDIQGLDINALTPPSAATAPAPAPATPAPATSEPVAPPTLTPFAPSEETN